MMRLIKTTGWLAMAAAIIFGTAACSSSDDSIVEQPVNPTEPKTYTMTVQATKPTGDAAATRGLSLDGNTLNVKWNEGEKVDVLQYIAGTRKFLGTLTAAASDGGSTTLTGTVSDVVETGTLEFYLHGYDRSYLGQTGVLLKPATGTDNSIETNYDYGIARVETGGFSISGTTVSVPGGVTFTSEQTIIKFSFVDVLNSQPLIVKSLSISGNFQSEGNQNVELSYNWLTGNMENGTLTVEPTTPASSFYVALKAYASDTYMKLTLSVVADNGRTYLNYEKSNVTLERGKYHVIKVNMKEEGAAAGHALTSAAVGEILGSDGLAYTLTPSDRLPWSVKAVAKIAYIGDAGSADASSNTYRGLALALTDASADAKWCYRDTESCMGNQYNENVSDAEGDLAGIAHTDYLIGYLPLYHNHEAASVARNYKYADTAEAGAHPTVTSAWFLPSAGQWKKMIDAAGGYAALRDGFASVGGTNMQQNHYWSSTQRDNGGAWKYRFSSGYWENVSKINECHVRAALAF